MKKITTIINFLLVLTIILEIKLVYSQSLVDVIEGKYRTEEYVKRDKYRNPLETLSFFGIKNDMTVLELQPSGGVSPGGWYTEILAPYLMNNGLLIAAHFNPKESKWRSNMRKKFEKRIQDYPYFRKIKMSVLSMPPIKLTSDNSVDMVLTFRNLHNWMKSGYLEEVFQVSYNALKVGGIFGVVEHRAPKTFSIEEMIKSGYVSESYVIEVAKKVGFKLIERSEINANPLDDKEHENGVWTLLPTLKLNDAGLRKKYIDIGESDRMTMKFIKNK